MQWLEDSIPRMLRLVPTPNHRKNMIRFKHGKGSEGAVYPELTKEITNLFDLFREDNAFKRNVTNCNYRVTPPSDKEKTCFFDTTDVRKHCTPENDYGYAEGSPCIFIQFNHVFNFTPEVYNKADLEDQALPEGLRGSYQFKGPWVECKGNEVIDIENAGKISVLNSNELPRFAFPYTGHPDYLAPFVAIKLEKPKTDVGISITCRLWARNVVYNETTSGLNDTFVDEKPVPSAILPFNVFIE
jgi:sodium/potassium-transporting ATPase subunit beta